MTGPAERKATGSVWMRRSLWGGALLAGTLLALLSWGVPGDQMGGCGGEVGSGSLEALGDVNQGVAELSLDDVPDPSVTAAIKVRAAVAGKKPRLTEPCHVSLERLRDLLIEVVWSGVDGDHLSRVEVVAPSGNRYAMLNVPFSLEPTGPPLASWPGAPPQPVPIKRAGAGAKRTNNGAPGSGIGVEAVLPVVGTHIARLGLTGVWELRAYLDGDVTPRATLSCELE